MKRCVLFGSGDYAQRMFHDIKKSYEIIAFIDNSSHQWGKELFSLPIYPPQKLQDLDFDSVIITAPSSIEEITRQLTEDLAIPKSKIDTSQFPLELVLQIQGRLSFLKSFAQIVKERNIPGEIAELGVFRGEFAKFLNRSFPDRKLYLFDTFEGFDIRDLEKEPENQFDEEYEKRFSQTSLDLVMSKMKYPENCVIKKGFFPETAEGVNETFAFVHIDCDLYQPILEGLRFFYPRLEKGGILSVHDYFYTHYSGAHKAVLQFADENGLFYTPMGDGFSILFIKS